MKTVIHKAESRGFFDHGWLKTFHSFSFANYYDPGRMGFGVLRVLNDDTLAPGEGFGMHPHDNMEIITIPLEGELSHRDSMGNSSVIKSGEVQVMSAGSGVRHSEFNASGNEPVSLLQIWLYPNKRNVTPRYDQAIFDKKAMQNNLIQIVSPIKSKTGVWIHQNAWFHSGNLDKESNHVYVLKSENAGVYIFVIEGRIETGNTILYRRDGMGISEIASFQIKVLEEARILLMEVPMLKPD